jgi:pimeloyl-ACP methyl ester carboxylesterase
MIKRLLILLMLVFIDGFATSAHAECAILDVSVKWKYCIDYSANNDDIIYFFHGTGSNEKRWADSDFKKTFDETFRSKGSSLPTVVSVSLGPAWALIEKNYDSFWAELVPSINLKLGATPKRIFLIGESMGGYNAIQLYARFPRFFSGVLLLSPAIWKISPWSSLSEIIEYKNSTGADYSALVMMLAVTRYGFTKENWVSNDPMTLAKKHFSYAFPPMYISCGMTDRFGLCPAINEFADFALSTGIEVTTEVLPGGHTDYDLARAAQVLESWMKTVK